MFMEAELQAAASLAYIRQFATAPIPSFPRGNQSPDDSLERNGVRGKLLEVLLRRSNVLEPATERTEQDKYVRLRTEERCSIYKSNEGF
jgi:hypothetical protein